MSTHGRHITEQHNAFAQQETFVERARIHAQRVSELELLVKEFISCVENPGAQQVWDEGFVDLIYTYEKACGMLGMTPQSYDETVPDIEDYVFSGGAEE